MMSPESVRTVAPALERYTHERLLGEVWRRPGLSVRDRSLVTLAVLIARSQSVEMPYYLNLALENGVKPSEISEITRDVPMNPRTSTRPRVYSTLLLAIGVLNGHIFFIWICILSRSAHTLRARRQGELTAIHTFTHH